jgi:hypothetical protein
VLWEAVENNKAMVSLFKPRPNIEEYINEMSGMDRVITTIDVDGDDDEDDVDIDDVDAGDDDDYDRDDEDEDGDKYEDGDEYEDEDDYDDAVAADDDDADDDDAFESEEGSVCYWDSDKDNFMDLEDNSIHVNNMKFVGIVGLHPHKDVVFLMTYNGIFAYHFRTSRMQYLGSTIIRNSYQHASGIDAGFPYRPCYVDALPTTKLPYRHW